MWSHYFPEKDMKMLAKRTERTTHCHAITLLINTAIKSEVTVFYRSRLLIVDYKQLAPIDNAKGSYCRMKYKEARADTSTFCTSNDGAL